MKEPHIVERAGWENIRSASNNEVIVERDWVQLTTPGAPTAMMNAVMRAEMEDSEAEEKISRTIEHYRRLNLPFRWKTYPSSRPANIDKLLIKHGLVHKDRLFGLIASPGKIEIEPNAKVDVKALQLDLKADWLKVQSSAWGVPAQGIAFLDKNFEREFEPIVRGTALALIAYVNEVPVASASILMQKEYGYLVGAATDPAYRRQGVYRALMKKRLDILREKNLPAVMHCIWNTSAPICLALGFEKVCEINSYELVL